MSKAGAKSRSSRTGSESSAGSTRTGKTLRITLRRSPIGHPSDHAQTLRGLGLRKIRQTVERLDTPEIRGMVRKVIHLVDVQE